MMMRNVLFQLYSTRWVKASIPFLKTRNGAVRGLVPRSRFMLQPGVAGADDSGCTASCILANGYQCSDKERYGRRTCPGPLNRTTFYGAVPQIQIRVLGLCANKKPRNILPGDRIILYSTKPGPVFRAGPRRGYKKKMVYAISDTYHLIILATRPA